MRFKLFTRRSRIVECGWRGECHGPVTVGVTTAWPCGHSAHPTATPTCPAHLQSLLVDGGTAPNPVPCTICGVVGAAKVVATEDL